MNFPVRYFRTPPWYHRHGPTERTHAVGCPHARNHPVHHRDRLRADRFPLPPNLLPLRFRAGFVHAESPPLRLRHQPRDGPSERERFVPAVAKATRNDGRPQREKGRTVDPNLSHATRIPGSTLSENRPVRSGHQRGLTSLRTSLSSALAERPLRDDPAPWVPRHGDDFTIRLALHQRVAESDIVYLSSASVESLHDFALQHRLTV